MSGQSLDVSDLSPSLSSAPFQRKHLNTLTSKQGRGGINEKLCITRVSDSVRKRGEELNQTWDSIPTEVNSGLIYHLFLEEVDICMGKSH